MTLTGIDKNNQFYVLEYGDDFARVIFHCPAFEDNKISKEVVDYCEKHNIEVPFKNKSKRINTADTPIEALVNIIVEKRIKERYEEIKKSKNDNL